MALIELGGGYRPSDFETYFRGLGHRDADGQCGPVSTARSNQPTGSTSGPDTEVILDIEVVGSIAQGANIIVYFAPNTDQGFADAISAAVHDATRAAPGHLHQLGWSGKLVHGPNSEGV